MGVATELALELLRGWQEEADRLLRPYGGGDAETNCQSPREKAEATEGLKLRFGGLFISQEVAGRHSGTIGPADQGPASLPRGLQGYQDAS